MLIEHKSRILLAPACDLNKKLEFSGIICFGEEEYDERLGGRNRSTEQKYRTGVRNRSTKQEYGAGVGSRSTEQEYGAGV